MALDGERLALMNMEPRVTAGVVSDCIRRFERSTRHALVHGDRTWTFQEAFRAIERVERQICARVARGSRIAVLASNNDRTAIVLLAIVESGAVAVPLHPDTPEMRLRSILRDCAPSLVLTDADVTSSIADWSGPTATIEEIFAAGPPGAARSSGADPDDLAVIFYTSGSTGRPRGVACPQKQVAFCIDAINGVIQNVETDIILGASPFSFDYGFYQMLLAFSAGAALVPMQHGSTTAVVQAVRTYGVTGLPAVPSLVGSMIHSNMLECEALHTIRYITSTGDVLPLGYIDKLHRALPAADVLPMYGLTECKRVAIMPRGMLAGRETSVGLPLPGTFVRVCDAAGLPCETDATGELRVSGPHLTSGYWNDAERTEDRFITAPSGARELRTGDMFRVDREGFLYFVGRAEGVIKSYGERVDAAEVESVVSQCAGVSEVAVIGCAAELAGQIVVAIVVTTDTQLDLRRVREHCANYLPAAAIPARLIVSPTLLPRTNNGKVDRRRLRAEVERRSDGGA